MTDFLQRESELLGDEFTGTPTGGTFATADGEFDVDRAASAFPDISLDGSGDVPALPSAAAVQRDSFSFDAFDAAPPAPRTTEVKVTGDDEFEKFEDQFPDIEVPQSSEPERVLPAFPTPTFAPQPQQSAYSSTPILSHTAAEEEPEVIKQWRERQQEEIQKRDEESKAKRQDTIGKAERAIDKFYEEYAAKKERNIRENKEHEEEFRGKLTDTLSEGTTWSRICDLIDLQNSQSKTLARAGPNTTDLSRLKEVLLRLKREGDAAPGAAGY